MKQECYDEAPMLGREELNDGYDLQNCAESELYNLCWNRTIIWTTSICTGKSIMRDGRWKFVKMNNCINPCRLVYDTLAEDGEDPNFRLIPIKDKDKVYADDKYAFTMFSPSNEIPLVRNNSGYYDIKFKKFIASTSYEYVNRRRYDISKFIDLSKDTIYPPTYKGSNKYKAFSISDAKEALSEKYNIPIRDVVIGL